MINKVLQAPWLRRTECWSCDLQSAISDTITDGRRQDVTWSRQSWAGLTHVDTLTSQILYFIVSISNQATKCSALC